MEPLTQDAIERVLDAEIRPNLALHRGDIEIEALEGTTLRVRLLGQCSGCPSAELTMEHLVREALAEAFPQLQQIVLVTGVSDDLIARARQMLKERHQ